MNGYAWFHLQGLHRPVRKENKRIIQNANISRPSIEPATLWFLAGHLDRLAIETVDYLCFKLLQYGEVTGNAWGVSNTWQYNNGYNNTYCNIISDKICISFADVDVIYYCLHLNFNSLISCISTCLETPYTLPVTSLYCNSNQLSRWPSGLDVRLEIKRSLVRYSAETYISILNFSLVSLPNRSAEPLQMKSSMTIHL